MDMDQGTAAVAAASNGHPGTVKPLDPKQVEARFHDLFVNGQMNVDGQSIFVWRVEALKRWRAYSEALLNAEFSYP